MKDVETLKKRFLEIKKKGWIKSIRSDYGGIGVTFEHLLGVEENCFEIPDFGNIELKTKRAYSSTYTNLFNCTPTGPHYHEIERIKNYFGYPDKILKEYKVLNTNVYANIKNNVGINYFFQLNVDKISKKISLLVFNKNYKKLENIVYWDFDILEEKLFRKLKTLAVARALSKKINKQEYFKFFELKIYHLKNFETFVNLIESGIIRITFKIGVYRSGSKKGQIHDRGTSFNIKESDINKLYNLIDQV